MKEISKSAATDLELVEAMKNGNKRESEKAFNTLFKKYHDSMLFHFKGLMKNDEDAAKELILEAFMKMNSNLEKYNKDTAVFSTWLFKLTQNLFVDRLRRKKEETISLTDLATFDEDSHAMEFDIASDDKNPEDEKIISERNIKINSIIGSMKNPEFTEIVKMRYFDGMPYEEIGQQTGKSIGTIKASLHRAKLILKDEFLKANITL